jgi:hypothetical protein
MSAVSPKFGEARGQLVMCYRLDPISKIIDYKLGYMVFLFT